MNYDLFRKSGDACIVNLGHPTKAARVFERLYGIPIVRPDEIGKYGIVMFSLVSFRDFESVARIAHLKTEGQEWIAGGNAATNSVGINWIMDYVWIGDAFMAMREILSGLRDHPSMLKCSDIHPVSYHNEPIFQDPISKSEILLSKGCVRRCLFCVHGFREDYMEHSSQKE